jgi:two-component system chemotaxis sensor kinase CheA
MNTDPYRYFRIEARELLEGLNQGVLELEKGKGGKELVGRLLRHAHTLKGASRIVKQIDIGDLAHAVEDALGPYKDVPGAIPRERIDTLLKLLDSIAGRISILDPPMKAPQTTSAWAPGDDFAEAVRVDLGELDAFLEGLIETSAQVRGLKSDLAELEKTLQATSQLSGMLARNRAGSDGAEQGRDAESAARAETLQGSLAIVHRRLGTHVEQASRDLLQSMDQANRLRLLPANSIFAALERSVRDAAQTLSKRVEFQASGGETRLDAHILGSLRDALLHIMRNAVAHGIETESQRVAAGKSPAGRVELSVERRGNRILFACRDDGRGVNVEGVRRKAVEKGLIPAAQAATLGAEEVIRLILRGGVTTMGSVDGISGRGIGLDVVRDTAARLKGDVQVRTEQGRGTVFEITVPVTLSSLPAILVEAGSVTAAIPLDAVPCTRRLAEGDIARASDGASMLHDGRAIPLVVLSRLVEKGASPKELGGTRSVVVVRSGAEYAALVVDRIVETSSVVVRRLPVWVTADPVVAGVALDAGGAPLIVLDPDGLVRAAQSGRGREPEERTAPSPVLVVDDSLTTRMLEQSILESSGYEVDLAVSGEEGLSKARRRKYGLFIVDIEMPGMDGFEFIAQARADATIRDVPAILVTSRSADEDRRRGEQVGACAYIVKSEFDQGRLLEIIRGLIG